MKLDPCSAQTSQLFDFQASPLLPTSLLHLPSAYLFPPPLAFLASPDHPFAAPSVHSLSPHDSPPPQKDRIRFFAYGSPRAIEFTIKQLHKLGYVDHNRWNPVRDIPENGIHISPAEAQAYSFLCRELLIV